VTGDGLENPQNLEVLFGTPMHILIDQCQRKSKIKKLVMGGPMTGFTLPNDEMPVIKTTNCLIVFTADIVETPVMPCIRCGACANVCPVNLLPQQLYWHIKANDLEKTQEYHIFECIRCGCCAYVCPSNIPLVCYFSYAMAEIRAIERKRKKAEIAKQRHEFRAFRIERNKQANQSQQKMVQDKSAAIKAAIERVKAKKEKVIQS
jgi:electron transport complex protein RnfC